MKNIVREENKNSCDVLSQDITDLLEKISYSIQRNDAHVRVSSYEIIIMWQTKMNKNCNVIFITGSMCC